MRNALLTTFMLGLACIVTMPDHASAQELPVGWYDARQPFERRAVRRDTTDFTVLYLNSFLNTVNGNTVVDDNALQEHLDDAASQGVEVILETPRADTYAGRTQIVGDFVAAWDSHPAVTGWYTADEPGFQNNQNGVPRSNLESAYNAVKAESSKPVYMALAASINRLRQYQNAYDVAISNFYPHNRGEAEHADTATWVDLMRGVDETADDIGKTWIPLVQAFGGGSNNGNPWRLPTRHELRFMSYHPLEGDAVQNRVSYYAHFITRGLSAQTGEPYEGSGQQWLDEVFEPLASELGALDRAVGNGRVDLGSNPGLNEGEGDINSLLYFDPELGLYVGIVTKTDGNIGDLDTVTLEFEPLLDGLAPDVRYAVPLFGDGDPILLDGDARFDDVLTTYDVRVYQFSATPEVVIPEPGVAALFVSALLAGLSRRPSSATVLCR